MTIKLQKQIASRALHGINSRMEYLYKGVYQSEFGEMTVPVLEVRCCQFSNEDSDEVIGWGERTYLLPNDWENEVKDIEAVERIDWSEQAEFDEEIKIIE